MAPPATKRRKLRHSDKNQKNTNGFAGFGSDSQVSDDDVQANSAGDSDALMGDSDVEEHSSEDELDKARMKEQQKSDIEEPAPNSSGKAGKKPQSQPGHAAQSGDGVYNAEAYKSNMFKLQMDDLLQQVRVKYGKKEASAENAMRVLKGIIEQLPSREPLPVSDAQTSLNKEKVVIPFPQPLPPQDAKYKLQYLRPASINATGSYPLKIATRHGEELGIDLVVTMPEALFQEKDYLNYRYFYKRSYYLACLAAGIKNCKEHKFKVSFDCLGGNQLQPVIIVAPGGDGSADDFSSSKCTIRIILAVPETTFPKAKLRPQSNCVRTKTDEDTEFKVGAPTPFYNATIQSDASVTAYLKLLHAASVKCDAFKDACMLGRVWLRQRGFGTRIQKGGFGNFEWTALMALLLLPNSKTGGSVLSPGYSSYQLFKGVLQFLARHDLSRVPYLFDAENMAPPKADQIPMFLDGPRNLNVLFKMTAWSYAHLQQEAKASVDMLRDSVNEHFESTFIAKTDLLTFRYDATLEVPLAALNLDSKQWSQSLHDSCRNLYSALSRALTNRVVGMEISIPNGRSWSVFANRPVESAEGSILVNLAIDASNAGRTVDHGPSAEDKKGAASFRKFWGEKAELRRFKDGSILETVVWSTKDTKMPVLEQIVRYGLTQHFSSETADQAKFTCDSFSQMISAGRTSDSNLTHSGIAEFSDRMNAFATLEKDIRSLEGLPLSIRHISPADPLLRYTAVQADSLREAASVTLQFEGSNRWPDDVSAIQTTKGAFLLKMVELLTAQKRSYTAHIGRENQSDRSKNQMYLDIHQSSGFTFRLRIHNEREAYLLDRQLKDKTLDGPSREAAASALALYKSTFIHAPAHTQALQKLCTRYPALSPSIRLTKRWFAVHLLSPHFSPELIELLVVRTFLQPEPWSIPACATTGFLRTLFWISRWDWRHTPLIVDFSSNIPTSNAGDQDSTYSTGLKADDVEKVRTRFEAWRRIDPAMNRVVLFAATNLDTDGTTWTDSSKPAKVVAARMTSLARAATDAIRNQDDVRIQRALHPAAGKIGKVVESISPRTLFAAQLHEYDILVHMSTKDGKSKKKANATKFKNLEIQQATAGGLPDEPTGLFATDLNSIYGDAILWFWDPEKLDTIAGLWNPVSTAQRSWKVKPGWTSVPVDGKEGVEIQVNKDAVAYEIARLGGDLVAKVELKR